LEPKIDYQQSILLTQDEHIQKLEKVATKKHEAVEEKKRRRLDFEENKGKRAEEKKQKLKAKEERAALVVSKRKHNKLWSVKNIRALEEKLNAAIKANQPIEGYRAPYCGYMPPVCKENQRIALMSRRAKKKESRQNTYLCYVLFALLDRPSPFHSRSSPTAQPTSSTPRSHGRRCTPVCRSGRVLRLPLPHQHPQAQSRPVT